MDISIYFLCCYLLYTYIVTHIFAKYKKNIDEFYFETKICLLIFKNHGYLGYLGQNMCLHMCHSHNMS